MSVIKSGTKKAISSNISEIMHSYKRKGTIGTSKPKSAKKAQKQAIAIALSTARRYGKKKALGGPNIGMESMLMHGASYGLRHEGMIHSSIPGRTDKLPMNVKSGSYVLPADIPSALGQGNTMAGGEILKKMFSSGPYGMAAPRIHSGRGAPAMRMSAPRMRQDGGEAEGEDESHVPIIAAGGEYIIHPDVVRDIGHGDLKAGHKVLDKFVLKVRKDNIKTLKKLPGPKQ